MDSDDPFLQYIPYRLSNDDFMESSIYHTFYTFFRKLIRDALLALLLSRHCILSMRLFYICFAFCLRLLFARYDLEYLLILCSRNLSLFLELWCIGQNQIAID